MDCLELRTEKDCCIFEQVNLIYRLNDMCRALYGTSYDVLATNDTLKDIYRKLKEKNIDLQNQKHTEKYLPFHRYCAYLILLFTLQDIFGDNCVDESNVSVERMRQLNQEELNSYWLRNDQMSSEQSMDVIKDLITKQCRLISYKCYASTKNYGIRCWLCDVDASYLGIGRIKDSCNNSKEMFEKTFKRVGDGTSTSFEDTHGFNNNCSHILSSYSKGRYDRLINSCFY